MIHFECFLSIIINFQKHYVPAIFFLLVTAKATYFQLSRLYVRIKVQNYGVAIKNVFKLLFLTTIEQV